MMPVPHPARHHFCPPLEYDVGGLPRRIDDAEPLDRVDDEQAVADDLADALDVAEVPGARVDEAHRDGADVLLELLADLAGRDLAVIGLEPDRLHGVQRLLSAHRRDRQARELPGRQQHAAGEPEHRVHEALRRVRLEHDLVGREPGDLGCRVADPCVLLEEHVEAAVAGALQHLGERERLFGGGRRERTDPAVVEVPRLF